MSSSPRSDDSARQEGADTLPGLGGTLRRPGRYGAHVTGRLRRRLGEPDHRAGAAFTLVLAAVLLLGVAALVWMALRTPATDTLEQARFAQASVAYTADGEVLIRYHDKNRVWVRLDEISPYVVDALIATEDRRFYEHRGVDVRRTLASVWKTLQGDTQGGSTLTMQFARNAFPSIKDDPMLVRKYKEWITALRLEDTHDKEAILEMYLNTVPFLYNAFGIEAAARTYFQKPASALNALEAATLVGMLKGPTLYNPVRNPEQSRERRNVVLEQMAEANVLPADSVAMLQDQETPLDFEPLTHENNMAPYFAEHLRQWLDEWAEDHGYNLYTDGLQIYTTLDSELQRLAKEAVREVGGDLQHVAAVEWSRRNAPLVSSDMDAYAAYQRGVDGFSYFWQSHPELTPQLIRESARYQALTDDGVDGDAAMDSLRSDAAFVDSLQTAWERLEASFVAIRPSDGHVKAWVGGRDYSVDQFDRVAQARRQPGSTFKPFVYAAALDHGYAPTSLKLDRPVRYRDPDTGQLWEPTNVGGTSGEIYTLREALAQSKNTITAQLVLDIGAGTVVDYARQMGIQSELQPYPSIGLGTSEVSLLELAAAYTPLANQGRYQEPVFVTRIENADGRVVATFSSASRDALASFTAYDVLDMMRSVIDEGTGRRIRSVFGAQPGLAAKTGTSQDGADGWFMLLHPDLVMGAWVGFNSPTLSFRTDYWGQGAHNALYVVGNVYREAGLPRAEFREPPGWSPPEPPDARDYAAFRDTLTFPGLDTFDLAFDSLDLAFDSLGRFDRGFDDEPPEGVEPPEPDDLTLDDLPTDTLDDGPPPTPAPEGGGDGLAAETPPAPEPAPETGSGEPTLEAGTDISFGDEDDGAAEGGGTTAEPDTTGTGG